MRSEFLAATAFATTIWFTVPGAAVALSPHWAGPYIGASVGVVTSNSAIDLDGSFLTRMSGSAPLAALDAGYNFPVEKFVVGIEADGRLINLDTKTTAGLASIDEKLSSLFSVRGRFGITAGNVLLYGTAGIAGGQTSSSVVDNGYGPATTSSFAVGPIGGAGVEVAVTDNVSITGQGLLYSLSSSHGVYDNGYGNFNTDYHPSGLLLQAGVNVHF